MWDTTVTERTSAILEFAVYQILRNTRCPRKFVPRLPEDCNKAAKGPHHTFT